MFGTFSDSGASGSPPDCLAAASRRSRSVVSTRCSWLFSKGMPASVSNPRTGMRCAIVMIVVSPRNVHAKLLPSFCRGKSGSEAGAARRPRSRANHQSTGIGEDDERAIDGPCVLGPAIRRASEFSTAGPSPFVSQVRTHPSFASTALQTGWLSGAPAWSTAMCSSTGRRVYRGEKTYLCAVGPVAAMRTLYRARPASGWSLRWSAR